MKIGKKNIAVAFFLAVLSVHSVIGQTVQRNPNKNLYFGDTHLHTAYSTDAFMFGTQAATPETAFRFAMGETIIHPATKQPIRLHRPLDFLVVSDHSEGLGLYYKALTGDPLVTNHPEGKGILEVIQKGKNGGLLQAFMQWIKWRNENKTTLSDIDTGEAMKSIWQGYTTTPDKFNNPGKFTAFIGWEWTSTPNGKNMHRVVLTPDDSKKVANILPFSSAHSEDPDKLFAWLDKTSNEQGITFMAIPHNSNISGGLMFPEEKTYSGAAIDETYVRNRAKWESVAEITQIKGTSESNPMFSPNDEFANYEIWNIMLTAETGKVEKAEPKKNDYLRYALGTGMKLEDKFKINPYKYGLIGSSDAHGGFSGVEEDNFQGKFYVDGLQADKNKEVILTVKPKDFSSSGIAAVWADSNTREDIYKAFKRKEVYGTTGTRIQLRVFGGFNFTKKDLSSPDFVSKGYQKGVPMGGDLSGKKPVKLMIQAAKDADGANLDRVQVVKVWLENGEVKEKVFDVAWSGDRKIGSDGKLAAVGNTVDVKKATYTDTIGANEISTVWTDPEFKANQKCLYYVRVLEIPTPRFSTYASAKLGKEPIEGTAATIQERAFSSPIWFMPKE